MRQRVLAGLVAGAALAASLHAQSAAPAPARDAATEAARGYAGVPSPKQAQIDASEQPITGALNGQAAAASAPQAAAASVSAEQQAQYDVDRAAYVEALVKHDAAVDRSDARYARQQRAYADAMAVWRVQVAECKKGRQSACRMPPPSVADYY